MARVIVRVQNEGAPTAVRTIEPAVEGETPQQVLERKAASHVAHGWTVEWTGPAAFHAFKCYPENEDDPDEPSRKDRYFEVK